MSPSKRGLQQFNPRHFLRAAEHVFQILSRCSQEADRAAERSVHSVLNEHVADSLEFCNMHIMLKLTFFVFHSVTQSEWKNLHNVIDLGLIRIGHTPEG